MTISRIHSFLVHPAKNEIEQPNISGANLPLRGKLFTMLASLYNDATSDCEIEVVFRHSAQGTQHNECRSLLLTYLDTPRMNEGRAVAARLQTITTNRSGLALLFLIVGIDGTERRLMIARFPADQGIVAHERASGLDVEFIERVFMKSAKAYKAAYYAGTSLSGGFWDGRAVDKQITGPRELSNYWINDFLDSELRTTGAAGTKRLALALRDVVRTTSSGNVRQQLLSAATLLRSQDGRRVSGSQLAVNLGLSNDAVSSLRDALPRPELFDDTFEFSYDEFDRHAPYRSVELDNGALMIGDNANFDFIFKREALKVAEGRFRYTTEGAVVNEKIRKTK